MSTLTNRTIKSTYDQLLHVENNVIQDGLGTSSLSASLDLTGLENITGSLNVSGSTDLIGTSSISGSLKISGTFEVLGTASISHLITTYESSSIIYASGSTKFGDDVSDIHERTGSMTISGSLFSTNISGTFSGSYKGDASGLTGTISSSFAESASFATSGTYALSASEATTATNVFVIPDNTAAGTHYLLFSQGVSGSHRAKTDDGLYYTPSTNTLTATKFIGQLEGNATSADTASIVLGSITSASFAVTASYAESQSVINVTSGSFAASGDGPFTGSFSSSRESLLSGSMTGSFTGSFTGSGVALVGVVSTSFAETASFALNAGGGAGAGFPFSGSADITGSLNVSGSTSITGSLNATSITETSALRFKENINEITSSDIVYNLRPVTFDWKKDGSHDIGLIAEEVGNHMTELVSKDQEGNIEGVKYTKLTSLLIKAVQDQQQTINELTTRISNLEN
ncbi:tail fiber domain-containing protein [bacterium]|nr:tail fiber domain-containing protein [bacterium]